jgi:hypothetical protein
MKMKPTQHIQRLLLAAVLAAGLCACRPATTFADRYPISEILDAASMDIPAEGQYNIDGTAVLAIVNQAVPSNAGFKPTTMVSLFDSNAQSYVLYFSKDRRYFMLNDDTYRLTRRQAKRVNKLI